MKIGDIMSRTLATISPRHTVKQAAGLMRRKQVGILPVVEGERMTGIITDRDIALRVVAAGKSVSTCAVGDVMTEEVHYCLEDDAVEDVARRLGDLEVRRMPVLDRTNHPVGMISLDDIAAHAEWEHAVIAALRRISAASRTGHPSAA